MFLEGIEGQKENGKSELKQPKQLSKMHNRLVMKQALLLESIVPAC